MTQTVLSPRLAQICVEMIGRAVATFAIAQGVAIIGGGRIRWSAEAFEIALRLPGAPTSWGVALAIFGAMSLCGSLRCHLRMAAAGFFLTAAWSFFFAGAFAITAARQDTASTTGVSAYALIAVISVVLCALYHKSRRDR